MTPAEAEAEVRRLRTELERHTRLYYVDAAPEISDREYDQLYRRLEENAQLLEFRCVDIVEEFIYGSLVKQAQ